MKFAAILLLAATASATVEHYYDHSVYRLRPSNATQLKLLQSLEEQDVRTIFTHFITLGYM